MDEELSKTLRSFGLVCAEKEHSGRGLFAAKRFKRGDVVLKQAPFASVLHTQNNIYTKRCHTCFSVCNEVGSTLRCSKCQFAHYCSVEHQRQDWPSHKSECEMIRATRSRVGQTPTSTLLLLSRVLRKLGTDSDTRAGMRRSDVLLLETHFDEVRQSASKIEMYAQVSTAVKQFHDCCPAAPEVDVREGVEVLCRFACNNHTICDSELRPIGIGLYPLAALVNHSCVPNCVQTFEGDSIVFRSLTGIDEGSELFISYVELAASKATRKRELLEGYFFDCVCPLCSKEEDPRLEHPACFQCRKGVLRDNGAGVLHCTLCASELDQNQIALLQQNQTLARRLSSTDQLSESDSAIERKQELERAATIYEEIFFESHYLPLMRVREELTKLYLACQDWESALRLSTSVLETYKNIYQPLSPQIGLQCYQIAKLCAHTDRLTNALAWYRQADAVLSITHGACAFVRSLWESMRAVEMDARQREAAQGE